MLHHPRPTLFPYTTLFRSPTNTSVQNSAGANEISTSPGELKRSRIFLRNCLPQGSSCTRNLTSGRVMAAASVEERSEEHTSELQSRGHLVCRLLLEKKKEQ